jgi:hypothetical protein
MFVPNRPTELSWKTYVSIQRKPSMLEEGQSFSPMKIELEV